MTKWNDTNEAAKFVATADSRHTDEEIMKAIAFFARDKREAEDFWNGDFNRRCDYLSIWEHATNNGMRDGDKMFWGDFSLNDVCG